MTCEWKEDEEGNWHTSCGEIFILLEGSPSDNRMKACCYCAKILVEKKYEEICP